jgi:hypothetical protein
VVGLFYSSRRVNTEGFQFVTKFNGCSSPNGREEGFSNFGFRVIIRKNSERLHFCDSA